MMRRAEIVRRTAETDVRVFLDLDGRGTAEVNTGVGFLDHMLTLLARHGRFDLTVACRGDTHVDGHHSAEDVGICLGQAFDSALGDKRGIVRYGWSALPMDEALVLTAVDFSGRACLGWTLPIPSQKIGEFDAELVEEFWRAFAREAKCSFHFRLLAGTNSHHIAEGAFKSAARSLHAAVSVDEKFADEIPSTKGVL